MPYALLADLTVLVHLGFVAFVTAGGFLAWHRPTVLAAHVPAILWAAGITAIGWPCPLTRLENALRQQAGADGYTGAFLDRYVNGVLYPERYAGVAQALVAVTVLTSYAGLALRLQRSTIRSARALPAPQRLR